MGVWRGPSCLRRMLVRAEAMETVLSIVKTWFGRASTSLRARSARHAQSPQSPFFSSGLIKSSTPANVTLNANGTGAAGRKNSPHTSAEKMLRIECANGDRCTKIRDDRIANTRHAGSTYIKSAGRSTFLIMLVVLSTAQTLCLDCFAFFVSAAERKHRAYGTR